MPPTDDVGAALEQILKPFDEQGQDEDGTPNHNTFYDYFVLGGRWSGSKAEALIDRDRRKAFSAMLQEKNITVSGLQMGKPELAPASQIPVVDALWREWFPESGLSVCPLFAHSGEQLSMDVCELSKLPAGLTAARVIVAGLDYKGEKLDAKYMTSEMIWNGVNFEDTKWDGTVQSALDEHIKRTKHWREDYREANTPKPDWLVVTVDYHS